MKKLNKEAMVKKIKILVVLIFLTIFISYPYLNKLPLFAHDLSYHLNRIEANAQALKSGQFPVLIHSELADGLGYGNPLFYPEFLI